MTGLDATAQRQAPSISIVVPCYNSGAFLPGLLECLQKQSFQDFETILVDDGSNDADTLAAIAELPATVRVVRQANKGLSAARNAGIREASGRYLLPLDCDDRLHPDFLMKAVAAVSGSGDGGFVFAHMTVTGDIAGVIERRYNRFDQLFLNRLPYCILAPRSAWEQLGGYDENFRDGYEDWEFNIRLGRLGLIGICLEEPLFIYHVSQNGMLLSKSARRHGRLWSDIRKKHADLYTMKGLLDVWRCDKGRRGRFNLVSGAALLLAAKLLPENIISHGFLSLFRMTRAIKISAGVLAGSNTKPLRNA